MSWNNLRILAWTQYIKFNMRIKYDKYYLDEMWNCIQVGIQMWLFLKLKVNVWNKCYKNFDECSIRKWNIITRFYRIKLKWGKYYRNICNNFSINAI